MYNPSSSSSSPRPILKRQQPPSYVHARSKSPDRLNVVRFPPSPTLTRTYTAYSSMAYDRSPIIVAPNVCALPERGCPGPSSPPNRRSHKGNHLHPRAVSNHPMSDFPTVTSGVDDDPLRTPTRTPPSSVYNSSLMPAPSIPRPRVRGDAMIYTSVACSEQGYSNNSHNMSFLPFPLSAEDAHKARRRRQRDRSRERDRHRESKYTSYISDEGSSDGGCKSFSLSAGYVFGGAEDSCLGGF
ncbi:hypothetical protein BU15DRAFT_88311 [Melanogaster broomeanus]|nr:hypothetical protein BU15DRAFT_88311 [Melanogaster broomeanus]